MLESHQGEHFSAIDGEPGYMTFIAQSPPGTQLVTRDEVVEAMEAIVKTPIVAGTVERSRDAVVIDVPVAQAKQIAEVRHTHKPPRYVLQSPATEKRLMYAATFLHCLVMLWVGSAHTNGRCPACGAV